MLTKEQQSALRNRERAVEQHFRSSVRGKLEGVLELIDPNNIDEWGLMNYPQLIAYCTAVLAKESENLKLVQEEAA